MPQIHSGTIETTARKLPFYLHVGEDDKPHGTVVNSFFHYVAKPYIYISVGVGPVAIEASLQLYEMLAAVKTAYGSLDAAMAATKPTETDTTDC